MESRTPPGANGPKDPPQFSHAYCPSPHCCPSRATFFTGLYPSRHGVWKNLLNQHALTHDPKPGVAFWSTALTAAEPRVFRYQNPISDGLDPHGVRDCQVFRDGSRWYLTATVWPHWPRQEVFGITNPGVVLYASDDLLKWNEIFTGPDGRLWLSCHGILKEKPDQPMLVIAPLDFDAQGGLVPKRPTTSPQTIPLP